MKKNKKIVYILVVIAIIISVILIIFFNIMAKKSKIGNNNTSQEIVDYILNITSYESEIEVEVKSNKNNNKYIIKQDYKSDEESSQEILEPSNISGIKITKNNNNLTIENSKLSLKKIIEDYIDIMQNDLDLETFIYDYKNNNKSNFEENNEQIIMKTNKLEENMYHKYKLLYINRNTLLPEKLEIKDTNQNTIIYIIYNKIKIKN